MVTLSIETSQPDGTKYRLAIGCSLPLVLVSIISALVRW